jgi:hypothetical protein
MRAEFELVLVGVKRAETFSLEDLFLQMQTKKIVLEYYSRKNAIWESLS